MGYLLIFDVDGTLIDSEKTIMRCLIESSKKLGYSISDVRDNIGVIKLAGILEKNGVKENDITIIMNDYNQCYINTFEKDTEPMKDASKVLEKLQIDNDLGILTLKSLKPTTELLKRFFGGVRFRYIVCSDRPVKDKTDGIRIIIEEAGVDKESAYYIGDRASDMQSAKDAGIKSVCVNFGLGEERDLETDGQHLVARSFDEILKIFSSQT